MSVLGRPQDEDPIDLSRLMARNVCDKIIQYAELLILALDDRDDDRAELARAGLIANAKALQTAFSCLASAHAGIPVRAAATRFSGPPAPVQQPEDDAA